jgi:hypothetical protein
MEQRSLRNTELAIALRVLEQFAHLPCLAFAIGCKQGT